MKTGRPIVLDLFSGCGGFSLGAELAGFHTEVALDIDSNLQSSFRLNFPYSRALLTDIAKIEPQAWPLMLKGSHVDVVIGGPPCQGFSRIGKGMTHDPRRSLLAVFFSVVRTLSPKVFVMENVEGLLDEKNADHLHHGLSLLKGSYKLIGPLVLDAANFGAPTRRRRVVVIGYLPNETEAMNASDFTPSSSKYVSVRDAIADLPTPTDNRSESYIWGTYRTGRPSRYASLMRTAPPAHLACPLSREKWSTREVSGLNATRHTPSVSRRLASVKPGHTDVVSRFPRLKWEGLCPTLRAGTGPDRGSFQSVRPIHPEENRVITVREAARLQGFPDWFLFHPTIWHSFRMIGNSVSPLLSKAIFDVIASRLGSDISSISHEVTGSN